MELICRGLTKSYKGVPAVENVSFNVPDGSVTGLIGPNGAGKTTLMRMILDQLEPDAGTAEFGGVRLRNHPTPMKVAGPATESFGLDRLSTPRAFLTYLCAWSGTPRNRVSAVLAEVEADDYADRRIAKLSMGMRQRVALAVALLGEPSHLLLDEPQTGLDPEGVRWLRDYVRAFASSGGTVLISSHLLAELEQTVDRVVILNRTVRFEGTLTSLTDDGSLEDRYLDLVGKAKS